MSLRVGPTGTRAIGVDIGGTKVLAGLVTPGGEVSATVRIPTPPSGGATLLQAVLDAVRSVREVAAAEGFDIVGCGVGTAGVVLDNRVVSANELLPGWASIPLAQSLMSLLGRPTVVLNDVHASALAEVRLGAALGAQSALVVAVGTGIGGAVVQGGMVVSGRQGIAGSIGHLPAPIAATRVCACGAVGHIEAYAGGRAIEEIYCEENGRDIDLREIATLAASGEVGAASAIRGAGYLLGRVIGGAATLIDPDVVVLGGGVSEIGELFVGPVRSGMSDEQIRPGAAPRLNLAAFGEHGTLVGAALALFDR